MADDIGLLAYGIQMRWSRAMNEQQKVWYVRLLVMNLQQRVVPKGAFASFDARQN